MVIEARKILSQCQRIDLKWQFLLNPTAGEREKERTGDGKADNESGWKNYTRNHLEHSSSLNNSAIPKCDSWHLYSIKYEIFINKTQMPLYIYQG